MQAQAVKELLAYRLSADDAAAAKQEWYDIVEGSHRLWQGVSEPYKHVIRRRVVCVRARAHRHTHTCLHMRAHTRWR